MKYLLSDGSVVIRNDFCRCGLTAGCELCQPIVMRPAIKGVDHVVVNPTYLRIQHGWQRFEEIRIDLPIYLEALRA